MAYDVGMSQLVGNEWQPSQRRSFHSVTCMSKCTVTMPYDPSQA